MFLTEVAKKFLVRRTTPEEFLQTASLTGGEFLFWLLARGNSECKLL